MARLRRALQIGAAGERLHGDPLFDHEFYRWANPDSPRSVRGAARHFAVVGGVDRSPSADFSAPSYAAREVDVVEAGLNPFVHYVRLGRSQGRTVRPHFERFFLGSDGRLDRPAVIAFLRSRELRAGRGSVLRGLPHLLHAMPRDRARRFGDVLIALAKNRVADLGPVVVSGPHRGTVDGVTVSIVGEAGGILAEASLASLMVGGEVGRGQVATPNEESTVGEVHIEVTAGALVVPGSLARLAEHARRAHGRRVSGALLGLDGVPIVTWEDAEARGPDALVARFTGAPPPSDAGPTVELPSVGGATAVWWPAITAAASGPARPRALVVNDLLPTPDRDSGSLSVLSHVRTLVSLGYRVVYVPKDLFYHPRYTPALESWGVEVVDERFVDSFEQLVASASFAVALIARYPVFDWCYDSFRRAQPETPVLFAPLDLHHVRMSRQAAVSDDEEVGGEAAEAQQHEVSAFSVADATILASSSEVELVQALAPDARAVHMPMARDRTAEHGIEGWSERRDIVFVGSYPHPPNPDAVRWFLAEVWPEVAERIPDARFVAYGSDLPDELAALGGERVIMHGYIEHLADAFATARLTVVPLRFGAGVKGKITTAMLAGIPVVSTSIGVEGMDLGAAVVVAEGAQRFADAIVELWEDEERLTTLSREGLDVASTRFSFEAQRVALAALLDDLGVMAP